MAYGGDLAGAAILKDDAAVRHAVQSIIEILKPHERESFPVAYLIAQLSGERLPPAPRLFTAAEMYTDAIAVLKPQAESVPAAGVLAEFMEQHLKACCIPPGFGGHA
jgi:hypothetical protein